MNNTSSSAPANVVANVVADPVADLYANFVRVLSRFDWLAPLLIRLVFGYFWLETGWAKLHNLDGFTGRFMDWGIPFPAFSAALSAWAEFIGGALMMMGLATRLTMIPMIINMVVAMAVVVLPAIGTVDEFVELDETLYVLVFVWLLIAGPGKVSLDYLIGRRNESRISRGHARLS
jgi:putative oxidoreductase